MSTQFKSLTWVLGIGLILLAAGCTKPMGPTANETTRFAANEKSTVYPHADAFKKTAAHGAEFLRDATSCTSCHGEKLTGGITKARNCNACHESYPHSERFKFTAMHGKKFTSAPESCATCHGKNLDGGPSKLPSCVSCHSIYPHSDAFKKTALHGASFQADRESCVSCHNQRRGTLKSCTSCHEAYPHTTGFKHSAQHGKDYKKAPNRCTNCHSDAPAPATPGATTPAPTAPVSGGLAGACTQCHVEYPHTDKFKKSAIHGQRFAQKPESCIGCHNKSSGRKSCNTCHEAYPHTGTFKATSAHGEEYKKDPEACSSCHVAEPEAAAAKPGAPASCTQCHPLYPHSEDFKTSVLHGSIYLESPEKRQACLKCHVPGALGKDAEKKGCADCHTYPHTGNWSVAGGHGAAYIGTEDTSAEEKKTKEEGCLKCHGEKSTFRDRHPTTFVSCGNCHILLPHTKKFKDGDKEHIAKAGTYEGKCTACHTDYKRLMPESDGEGCFSCHNDSKVARIRWVDPSPSPSASPGK